MRAVERKLKLDATLTVSTTERLMMEPTLKRPIMETEEPAAKAPRILTVEPKLLKESTLRRSHRRVLERIEIDEPNSIAPVILTFAPNTVSPETDIPDPNRAKLRSETLDPRVK
jgi:hypothetical protein